MAKAKTGFKTQDLLYAVVGVGDLAIERVRGASKLTDRKAAQKAYRDLVKRGRALTTSVRSSGSAKQAIAQTKVARSQVKAAATSVTKAVRANAKASKSVAEKAAQAS